MRCVFERMELENNMSILRSLFPKRERSRRFKQRFNFQPAFERLEKRVMLSVDYVGVADSLDAQLVAMQSRLTSTLNLFQTGATSKIPIAGDQLGRAADIVSSFRDELREGLEILGTSTPTDVQIQSALTNRLNTFLVGAGAGAVHVSHSGNNTTIEMVLQGTSVLAGIDVGFDTGLPSLPVKIKTGGSLDVSVGYALDLAFTINDTNGNVTLTTGSNQLAGISAPDASHPLVDPNNQLALFVTAGLSSDFSAKAVFGFVEGSATPIAGQSNGLYATALVSNLLTAPTIKLDGSADANLRLAGSFAGTNDDFPGISADFHLHWGLSSSTTTAPPTVAFDNVSLTFGTFLSNVLKPALQPIKQSLDPIRPVLELLNTKVPGISDLSEASNLGSTTVLDLAVLTAQVTGNGPLGELGEKIENLLTKIDSIQLGANISLPLGGFDLNGAGNGDLRSALIAGDFKNLDVANLSQLVVSNLTSVAQSAAQSYHDIVNGLSISQDLKNELNGLATIPTQNSFEIKFPILDNPAGVVFNMLLGIDSDLFYFKADIDLQLSGSKASRLSFAGQPINFVGTADINTYFKFGYDTFGLRQLIANLAAGDASHIVSDITDGFYIDANSYFKMAGELKAEFGASVLNIFPVSIAGGIFTQNHGLEPVHVYIEDPNGDGKLRFGEFHLGTNGQPTGFLATGELTAELNIQVGFPDPLNVALGRDPSRDKTFSIASASLLKFATLTPQKLASQPDANGEVTLFLGTSAFLRTDAGGQDDGDEKFTIEHLRTNPNGSEDIKVRAFGINQEIKNVRKIKATDQVGQLTINVLPGVTSNVDFVGGLGAANLTYQGTGTASLTGGALASTLIGGSGASVLTGAAGDDTIILGSGVNTVNAGGGHNTVIAAAPIFQNSTISGGTASHNDLKVVASATTIAIVATPVGNAIDVGMQNGIGLPFVHIVFSNFDNVYFDASFAPTNVTMEDLSAAGVQQLTLDLVSPYPTSRLVDLDTHFANASTTIGIHDYAHQVPDPQHSGQTITAHDAEIVNSTTGLTTRLLGFHANDTLTLRHHGGSITVDPLAFTSGNFVFDTFNRPANQPDSIFITTPGRADGHMVLKDSYRDVLLTFSQYSSFLIKGDKVLDTLRIDVGAATSGANTIEIDASSVHGTLNVNMLGAASAINHITLSEAGRQADVSIFGQNTTSDLLFGVGKLSAIRHDVFASNVRLTVDNDHAEVGSILTLDGTTFGNWIIPTLAGETPHLTFSGLRGEMEIFAGAGDRFQLDVTPSGITGLTIRNTSIAVQDPVYTNNWNVPLWLIGNFSFYAGQVLHRDGTVERTKLLNNIHGEVTLAFNGVAQSNVVLDGDRDPSGTKYDLLVAAAPIKSNSADPNEQSKKTFWSMTNQTAGFHVRIVGYRSADTLYVYMPGATVDANMSKPLPGTFYFDGRARLTGTNPTAPNTINMTIPAGGLTMTPESDHDTKMQFYDTVYVRGSLPQDGLNVTQPTNFRSAANAIGANQTRFDWSLNGANGFTINPPNAHYSVIGYEILNPFTGQKEAIGGPITGEVQFQILTTELPGDHPLEHQIVRSENPLYWTFFDPRQNKYVTLLTTATVILQTYPVNADPQPINNLVNVDASQLRGSFNYHTNEPGYALAEEIAAAVDRFSGETVTNFGQTTVNISKTNSELSTSITGILPTNSTHYTLLARNVNSSGVRRWGGTQVNIGTGVLANIEGSIAVNQAWLKEVNDRDGTQPNIITVGDTSTTWTSASGQHPTLNYTNLQGSYTISGSPTDRFAVEGTPNSAYRTILRNFSTSVTPAGVYVMSKNVMPLEVTGNFDLHVGQRLNADGTVTALGQTQGAYLGQKGFVFTGGFIYGTSNGRFWRDFQLAALNSPVAGPITFDNAFYGYSNVAQVPLPIFFNFSGPGQGTFVFDMSDETRTSGLIEGGTNLGNGISTNTYYPGQANLRFGNADVIYGAHTEVFFYGPKFRDPANTATSRPILIENPFSSAVHYISNATNAAFTPIEQILIGNVLGPVFIEGRGRTTRVELNPLFSLPVIELTRSADAGASSYTAFPGWGVGHPGGFSLLDTIHADVTVTNAALRVIGDIPLPTGSIPPVSRPNVTVAGDRITGIAGSTIRYNNLVDSILTGNGLYSPFVDMGIARFPGLSVQLPAHAAVISTVENTPSGATTQITTVLSSSNSTFTNGLLTVRGTTGPLVLGELYGSLASNLGDHFGWPVMVGQPVGSQSWSDGISVSQIMIGDNGNLNNILGAILLKGDSHFTSATVTNIDGRNDAARSNVSFKKSDGNQPPINTLATGGMFYQQVYQQLDGMTAAPIYFGGFYEWAHALNVYGSPNSSYNVVSAPITMKLYAGQGSDVIARWPSMSIIGAATVHTQLLRQYSINNINFNTNPPTVPQLFIEQDPAHPQLVDLQIDPSDSFENNTPLGLNNTGNGLLRIARTVPNFVDSWHLFYDGDDVRPTFNYGNVTIADTGSAGTIAASNAGLTITVTGTTGPLQIQPVGSPNLSANVNIGNGTTLQNILGNIEITPNTTLGLNIDSRLDTIHRDVHLNRDTSGNLLITGMSPALIKVFGENSGNTLTGGTGGTTYFVENNLSPVLHRYFNINGTAANDMVVGPDQRNNWQIAGSSFSSTTLIFVNKDIVLRDIPNLRGGSLADNFVFQGGRVTGNIDGGPGTDTLYYDSSAFYGQIIVDLPNHTATGVQGQVLNIEASTSFAGLSVGNPGPVTVQAFTQMTPVTVSAFNGLGTKVFTATGLPSGITINPTTGVISGSTTVENYTAFVAVSATDDLSTRSSVFSFTVLPGLYLNAVANQTTQVETNVNLPISSLNAYGTTLTYSATGLPTGLSIDSQTGLISGSILDGAQSPSPYPVVVTATDGTHTATVSFSWTAIKVLAIINPGNQVSPEIIPVNLPIQVANAVGTVTYSATGLPSNLSINPQTGIISGSIGLYSYSHLSTSFNITVFATDSQRTVSTTFTLQAIPGFRPLGIANQTSYVGQNTFLSIYAYDPYYHAEFTYAFTNLPPGLTYDPVSTYMQGHIDAFAETNSPYHVSVTFNNTTYSYSYTTSFDWTVLPTIVVTDPGSQTSVVGDAVDVNIPIVRDFGQPLTFFASGLPLGLEINPATGRITGTIGPQTSSPANNSVTVYVSDDTYSTQVSFQWQVSSLAANVVVLADIENGGTVTLSSPAGTTLIASINNGRNQGSGPGIVLASGLLSIRVDGVTPGSAVDVTMTPSSNHAWESFYIYGESLSEPYGWYQFRYQRQTGDNDASTTGAEFLPNGDIVLHFVDGGRGDDDGEGGLGAEDGAINMGYGGPTITHLAIIYPGSVSALVGDVISLPIQTVYARGAVTFAATGLPEGLTINAQTGVISGTIAPLVSYPGYVDTEVTASDGATTTSTEFSWEITPLLTNIVVFPHPSGVGFIQLTAPAGTTFYSASLLPTPAYAPALAGYSFPFGYFSFYLALPPLPPQTNAIDITVSGMDTTQITHYFRYGSTPANQTEHWYDFLLGHATDSDSAVGTGMEIVGGNIVLHFVDGGRGDDDLSLNGYIYDEGGPAVVQSTSLGTVTTLTSNHTVSATYGDALHFTAMVSATSGTPTGTVQFQVDGQNVGTPQALSGGTAVFDVASLTATNHLVSAIYTSSNGTFLSSTGNFTQHVDPAVVMVITDNKDKVYGAALPTLTASFSDFVNGETSSVVTTQPLLSTTATATSHVGNFSITASGAVAPNYTFQYPAGSLSVTPAALTIKADDRNKVYGGLLPALTANFVGFVNGDTSTSLTTQPTLATTATAASHVGTFPITVSGAVNANYSITYQAGSLQVTPAALTIKADDRSKVYGAADPALTYSASGFVGDETISTALTGSLTRQAGELVGNYSILQGTVSAVDNNYAITFAGATFEIIAFPPTDIGLSNSTVAENAGANAVIGTLSASDPDPGERFTFRLPTGLDDNAEFNINGTSLRANASFNFEVKSSYTVNVRVANSIGLTFDKTFTITVSNVTEFGGIDVQNGQTQRSFVRYLDLVFDSDMGLLDLINNGRLQLTKFDLNGANGVVIPLPGGAGTSVSGTRINVDFGARGIGANRNTNAGDGYYEIGVDMDGNGSFETKKHFFRLFGDVTGDGTVDSADKIKVLRGNGTTSAESDVNGDGQVNVLDTALMSRAIGKKIKNGLF